MSNKQALGMIETKGLVALIEGADSMLKAANVTFAGWVSVGSGLVTVFVEGDGGAGKEETDAGPGSARRRRMGLGRFGTGHRFRGRRRRRRQGSDGCGRSVRAPRRGTDQRIGDLAPPRRATQFRRIAEGGRARREDGESGDRTDRDQGPGGIDRRQRRHVQGGVGGTGEDRRDRRRIRYRGGSRGRGQRAGGGGRGRGRVPRRRRIDFGPRNSTPPRWRVRWHFELGAKRNHERRNRNGGNQGTGADGASHGRHAQDSQGDLPRLEEGRQRLLHGIRVGRRGRGASGGGRGRGGGAGSGGGEERAGDSAAARRPEQGVAEVSNGENR